MAQDEITIEVLADGQIKVSTNAVGQANHLNAEQFLTAMARLAGGASTIKKKHGHSHTHTHGGVEHSH